MMTDRSLFRPRQAVHDKQLAGTFSHSYSAVSILQKERNNDYCNQPN